MSRYKSIETAYNPQKKKNVPIWRLDTNTITVTHFNADTLTEEIRPTTPITSGIIFIIQTANIPTDFTGSSTRVIFSNILMIWN